ncbi:MAG: glycosyltransferase family 2 protein [Vicinamibacterales bacterium]
MKYSVVIATHNRAADLRETLACLAGLQASHPWEVVVADNNSTDATADVVRAAASTFPVPLHYVFEATPGRSAALNTAIAHARGEIILTTDDDVRMEPDWLEQAGQALEQLGCDYIGGKVTPIWGGPQPAWLPSHGGRLWAVVALIDYGPDPFELVSRMPLGVNMAFKREVFSRVGGWDPRIGRKAGTLLGQEVREWCVRARAAGVRGCYAPNLTIRHIVPANRLNRRYFRRWFYWRGISRALLYQQGALDMENPQGGPVDVARIPHIFGVPRYLWRTALSQGVAMVRAALRGDGPARFEHELWLWMFAGIVRQRWRDRRLATGTGSAGYSGLERPVRTAR